MKAADLADFIPLVTESMTGAEAIRIMAEYRLPGVIVAKQGKPMAVLAGTQMLGVVFPEYMRGDRTLAHVFGEDDADAYSERLNRVTLGDLFAARGVPKRLPHVLPEDTVLEVAMEMVSEHCPIIAVVDKQGTYYGAITLARLTAALATTMGQETELVRRRLEHDVLNDPLGQRADGGDLTS